MSHTMQPPQVASIENMARQCGATDTDGSRAQRVFCFTQSELMEFSQQLVDSCAQVQADQASARHGLDKYEDAQAIREHFHEHLR